MSDKPRATPYRCTLCLTEKGCGYHGILRFPNAEVPTCDHHIEKGDHKNPLELPVPMVPVVK
jgi:predicted small lipoprotein YifL